MEEESSTLETVLTVLSSAGSISLEVLWYVSAPIIKFADRWPNLYWNLGYMIFLFWMYLFHAPFRVHSGSRTDWYAQATKFVQVWLAVTLTLFHLLPKYMERQSDDGAPNPGAVFFPLFATISMLLLAEHRAKRAWNLRVTYAPTAIALFLNGVLVSLFLTVHYTYCHHIGTGNDETTTAAADTAVTPSSSSAIMDELNPLAIVGAGVRWWTSSTAGASSLFWSYACPSAFDEHPLLSITHLLLCGALFVMGDYVYKGLRGFDPIRGLLWSESVRQKVNSWTTGTTVSDQPTNPPAMVPWYSTIIAHTAFQLFLGSNLNFLSFDFRGVERVNGPKIFRIHSESRPTSPYQTTPTTAAPAAAAAASFTPKRKGATGGQQLPAMAPPPKKEREKYFYFDWAADVGDGFNSTYEIARLLGQPSAVVPRTVPGRMSARKRLSAAVAGVAERGRTIQRTLSSLSFAATDELLSHNRLPLRGHRTHHKRSLSAEALSGSEERRLSAPKSALLPRQTSVDSFTMSEDDDANDAVLNLQRGAFALIGGDLAYPNPTEETYEQRLFGPYKDAIVPSSALRQEMQLHADTIVEERRGEDDTAHIHPVSFNNAHEALKNPRLTHHERQQIYLRSTPCLFAIPGNHDWIDGLATYRDYILGKSWLGGWYMPQKTSYFVLSLPANWYFFCLDTGLVEDIDADQLSYFMELIEKRLNGSSCVALICHEPGWFYDSYRQVKEPSQKRILKLCRKLGDRLRLRLCGDVHHYSRHIHKDALADAPLLVISGGGGAFLHGPRNTPIKHLNEPYVRAAAFPSNNTIVSIATRLFGFRIVNWQFDFIGGLLYFVIVFSNFPLPLSLLNATPVFENPICFVMVILKLCATLLFYMVNESFLSCIVCVGLMVIFVAIIEDKLPLWKRVVFGLTWAFLHILAATMLLSFLHAVTVVMIQSGMMHSNASVWASGMEHQVRNVVDQLVNSSKSVLVPCAASGFAAVSPSAQWANPIMLRQSVDSAQSLLYNSWLVEGVGYLVRLLDVPEGLAYLVHTVPDSTAIGVFNPTATRHSILMYYAYMMWFYWILATPVVSFIVGFFLLVSVHVTDTSYDAAYSAFQIEDYKHFIRFRLNIHTRELKGFVIGVDKVPKVWERDAQRVKAEDLSMPPHLQARPSVWKPVDSWRVPGEQSHSAPRMVDEFVVRPQRI